MIIIIQEEQLMDVDDNYIRYKKIINNDNFYQNFTKLDREYEGEIIANQIDTRSPKIQLIILEYS